MTVSFSSLTIHLLHIFDDYMRLTADVFITSPTASYFSPDGRLRHISTWFEAFVSAAYSAIDERLQQLSPFWWAAN
jgi:hypothetical protein